MEATATAGAGDNSAFEPSLWNDFFLSYSPPCSQMSEEGMRERADELKREVHHMFEAVLKNGTSVASGLLMLVDALQRLGIDIYFQEEIDTTLSRVHTGDLEMLRSSDELHLVALRFRLLRQHGHFVPTDVFEDIRDGTTGNFNTCLISRDPKGLLSLYNAAHMAVPGEDVLDDAIAFARTHLEAMKGNLASPMADQICRALDIPLPRYMPQLETMHFTTEYEQEDGHNATLLELARLDYCLTRSAHLKELRTICLWDESAASILPEYLRMYYTKMLGCFNEFEDILEPREKYRVRYLQKEIMLQSQYYLKEAKWCNEKYMPNFKDQIELSALTAAVPLQTLAALMAAGGEVTNKEAFEWASDAPDILQHACAVLQHACAELGRLVNDISAFKTGRKNKNDMASSLESYMKEHGTTAEEAATALSAMVEHAWRRMNKAFMEIDRALLPAASAVINQARTYLIVYHGGNDGYTFAAELEDLVTSVFLKPVPVK